MSHRIKCRLFWVAVLSVVIGPRSELKAQRPQVIAAAANLNFALTEIGEQFARDRGTRLDWEASSRRAWGEDIQSAE